MDAQEEKVIVEEQVLQQEQQSNQVLENDVQAQSIPIVSEATSTHAEIESTAETATTTTEQDQNIIICEQTVQPSSEQPTPETTPTTTASSNLQNKKEKEYTAHPDSIRLNIHSYGFGGVRYDNIVMVSSEEALIPIGACIARWDTKHGRRLQIEQTNPDSIFVLLDSPGFLVSISYSGSISIVEHKTLKVLRQFKSIGRIVRHACISNEYFAVSCEKYKLFKGITEVYSLSDVLKNIDENNTLKPAYTLKGRHRFATLSNQNILVSFLEKVVKSSSNVVEQQQIQSNQMEMESTQSQKKPVSSKKQYFYDITQHDLTTKTQINTLSAPYVNDIVNCASDGVQYGAYMYQDRHLMIIDLISLTMVSFSKILGTNGTIMSLSFPDIGQLVLSPAPNHLLTLFCGIPLPREVAGTTPGNFEGYTVQKIVSRAAHQENYFTAFVKDTLFAANEAGFVTQSMSNVKDSYTYNGMNVTCCGLATNSTESLVAVGDFIGNVYVFSTSKNVDNEPIVQTCVMSSIRSLTWDPSDAHIVIGTMEGSIYKWAYEDFSEQPKLIATLKGSITSLKYQRTNKSVKLMAANTEGQFAIFDEQPGNPIKSELIFYGHLPSSSTDRFGSLSKFAEIWSSTWDPNSTKRLATCSEDQKVHVFDLTNKQPLLIHELKGHTLAVTSVDWQEMSAELGEVFISCSDDQTLRVYSPKDGFSLVHTFSTAFVNEWHTLTYLALEKNGTRVAIGSQNGYFFVYDLLKKTFVYSEKVHMGGIEGLVWNKEKIVTCSSDCSVNIISLN